VVAVPAAAVVPANQKVASTVAEKAMRATAAAVVKCILFKLRILG